MGTVAPHHAAHGSSNRTVQLVNGGVWRVYVASCWCVANGGQVVLSSATAALMHGPPVGTTRNNAGDYFGPALFSERVMPYCGNLHGE